MTIEKIRKTNVGSHFHRDDFQYRHSNPYHDRLEVFDSFVLRDQESEANVGKWNENQFKNNQPIEVEIGTGYGEFMIEYCQNTPNINFIGLDHRFKRSYGLAHKLNKIENKNFRYIRARGERLGYMFGESEVQSIFYFFPDPWPKTRHNKKRLFQKNFLDDCHKVLKPGGTLFVKTDHDGYYEWMLDHLKEEKRFEVVMQSRDLRKEFPDHFLAQYKTKFEKIFLSQGTLIKSIELRNLKG